MGEGTSLSSRHLGLICPTYSLSLGTTCWHSSLLFSSPWAWSWHCLRSCRPNSSINHQPGHLHNDAALIFLNVTFLVTLQRNPNIYNSFVIDTGVWLPLKLYPPTLSLYVLLQAAPAVLTAAQAAPLATANPRAPSLTHPLCRTKHPHVTLLTQ